MQDRYVGDVGDFGKFGLLRALVGSLDSSLRLGVVWCAFPDESHNGDGRHIAYLRDDAMVALDPELHAKLRALVDSGSRSIAALEAAGILPQSTIFYRQPTTGLAEGIGPAGRLRTIYRERWHSGALQTTKDADLVFFDPDNGIATEATSRSGPKSGKFIFRDEIAAFWERGQSLVVYHHLNRTCTTSVQTTILRHKLADTLGRKACLLPLMFRRGSCRHFWIIAQPRHAAGLTASARLFLANGWAAHFGPVEDLQGTMSAGPTPSQSTRMPSGSSTTFSTNSVPFGPKRPVRPPAST